LSIRASVVAPSVREQRFLQVYCRRIRAARKGHHGWTQADIARALGIAERTYRRYETVTGLPHHLVAEFCAITGASMNALLALPSPTENAAYCAPRLRPYQG